MNKPVESVVVLSFETDLTSGAYVSIYTATLWTNYPHIHDDVAQNHWAQDEKLARKGQ